MTRASRRKGGGELELRGAAPRTDARPLNCSLVLRPTLSIPRPSLNPGFDPCRTLKMAFVKHAARRASALCSLVVLAALALFCALTSALPSASGNRVLVVVEPSSRPLYSTFFQGLTSRGYQVAFKAPRDAKPQLVEHDVVSFDHLVLLSPAAKSLAADLSPQQLVEYLKSGGNMLVALDSSASEMHRDLAREFSLEFDERATALVDHFRASPQLDAGNHTTVLVGGKSSAAGLSAGGPVPNTNVFAEETLLAAQTKPLLYRGIVHRVGANPLAFPLVVPPATSYSSEAPALVKEQDAVVESTSYSTPAPVTVTTTRIIDGETVSSEVVSTPRAVPTVVKSKSASKLGKNGWVANRAGVEPLETKRELVAGVSTGAASIVSLVSGFQLASNSARAVFVGSTDLLSDAFAGSETVNREVAHDLTAWTFQERGVLKVVGTHHHRVRSDASDVREDYEETAAGNSMYRIKDHVYYSLDVVQHVPDRGWVPADKTLDIQVAFRMLDPYITAHLVAEDAANYTHAVEGDTSGAFTRFATTFQVPDRHGVFTLHVNFKRAGLSFVETKDTAPVRPFNHDEYPRFLSSSWPYITGALSTSLGFVVFTALWLTLRQDPPVHKKTK